MVNASSRLRGAIVPGRSLPTSALVFGLVAAFCLPEIAQPAEAPAHGAVSTGDESAPQEIVVTARKRSERLEDVAETMSVFTAAEIEAAGIEGLRDFSILTPGVYFSGDWSPSVSTLTVRGVTNNPNGDAPVAFVVDGVAYGNSYLMGQDLFDIAQIEVLKGPQGALYGRNSIGGAINVTTRGPTNEWQGRVSATAGNGSLFKGTGSVSGPIVKDKLLFSLTATGETFDGLIENEFLHEMVDFKRGGSGRLRVLYLPSQDLSVDLAYTHLDYHTGSTYWAANNIPASFGYPEGVIQGHSITYADMTANDASAKVEYALPFGRITGIYDYQKVTIPRTVDIDFIPRSLTSVLTSPDTALTRMGELRFTSRDDARLRWFVGGFYQTQERIRAQNVSVNTNADKTPGRETWLLALVVPSNQPSTLSSGFAQAEFDLTPQWQIAAGLRHDSDRREDVISNLARTFTATTPKVTVSYRPVADGMVYATYSEGYRAGGYNSTSVFGRTYDPEKLKNYEIGFKARLRSADIRFNGALYYQDYDNQQFYVFSTAAASQALINAKKSHARGIELEARAVPLNGLELIAGVNVVDTKIQDFGTFRAFAGITEADINGKELLYTPKYTANLTGQYTWNVGSLRATFRTDLVAWGRIYWGFDNVESQSPVELANARFSLGNDRWTWSVYEDNVFDKRYDTFCFVGRFIGNANRINPCAHNTPRSYGMQIRYNF